MKLGIVTFILILVTGCSLCPHKHPMREEYDSKPFIGPERLRYRFVCEDCGATLADDEWVRHVCTTFTKQ